MLGHLTVWGSCLFGGIGLLSYPEFLRRLIHLSLFLKNQGKIVVRSREFWLQSDGLLELLTGLFQFATLEIDLAQGVASLG